MSYLLSTRDTAKGLLVAACDAEVLGETYEEDAVRLHVREAFYGGDEASLDAIMDALDRCFTANLVGNALIDALLDEGVLEEEEVEHVAGMAHSQLFRI